MVRLLRNEPAEPGADVRAMRAAREEAARTLMAALQDKVVRIAQAHLPRGDAVEDICQEIWLRVFSRLDQWQGRSPFEHWVARIATHCCQDRLRYRMRRPGILWSDLPPARQEALAQLSDPARTGTETSDVLALELLHQVMDQLAPADKALLTWLELEGKTIPEVCALTGWNSGLVRIRAFRARGRLRKLWEAAVAGQ